MALSRSDLKLSRSDLKVSAQRLGLLELRLDLRARCCPRRAPARQRGDRGHGKASWAWRCAGMRTGMRAGTLPALRQAEAERKAHAGPASSSRRWRAPLRASRSQPRPQLCALRLASFCRSLPPRRSLAHSQCLAFRLATVTVSTAFTFLPRPAPPLAPPNICALFCCDFEDWRKMLPESKQLPNYQKSTSSDYEASAIGVSSDGGMCASKPGSQGIESGFEAAARRASENTPVHADAQRVLEYLSRYGIR